jgi:hypothetical protein
MRLCLRPFAAGEEAPPDKDLCISGAEGNAKRFGVEVVDEDADFVSCLENEFDNGEGSGGELEYDPDSVRV